MFTVPDASIVPPCKSMFTIPASGERPPVTDNRLRRLTRQYAHWHRRRAEAEAKLHAILAEAAALAEAEVAA